MLVFNRNQSLVHDVDVLQVCNSLLVFSSGDYSRLVLNLTCTGVKVIEHTESYQ